MAMKNRVSITICDKEYVLITEEDEEYVRGLAKYIENMIEESVYKNLRSTKADAAVLTCLDLCDQRNKLQEANDNMRLQIAEYLDELAVMNKKIMQYERNKQKSMTDEAEAAEEKDDKAAL